MDDQNLLKALQSRRGKGIDVSIYLGNPQEGEDDSKKSDLAPAPDRPLDVDTPVGAPPQMQEQPLVEFQDSDLIDGMSDYDKANIGSRAPRSLGERARQEMLSKK